MSSQLTTLNILFRGLLNDYGDYDDDDDELDFGEIDSKANEIKHELDSIQPYRYPQLQLEDLGESGNVELIFKFRTTWMDREADLQDYLDEVQATIESRLDMIITERESLGITTR
ncbi:MAG: hypothetical protein GPJ54_22510 [Candidatus Heimdallarchaeota archaeon]|nr:hypothetical protein [Candidatus Heimdallarchaeota archaeon]